MRRLESYNPLLRSYPESDKVNAVSEGAEVLYVRLIAVCDDAGCYYGSAPWVLAKLFTARWEAGQVSEEEIERRLCELADVKLIDRYKSGRGVFLRLVNVFKTLRKDVAPKHLFPQPDTSSEPYAGRARDGDGPLDQDPEPDPQPEFDRNDVFAQRNPISAFGGLCARDVQKLAAVVRPKSKADWKLLARVVALKQSGRLSENAVWDALAGVQHTRKKVGNPVGYFQTCVAEKAGVGKEAFAALIRSVEVSDDELADCNCKPEPRLMSESP